MNNDIEFDSDDELLSAYLDGELPAECEAALERRLETDPALALRLERLSEADAALRDAYAPVVNEPMPRSVIDTIGTHAGDTGIAEDSRSRAVVDLGTHRRMRKPRDFAWPLALAASVTLAIGALVGYLIAPPSGAPEAGLLASIGSVARGSGLHDTLETALSGTTREIAGNLTATPVLSFESRGGEYCRELAITGADGSATALACRHEDGWQVEALGFLPDPARNGGQTGGEFRPAGRTSSAVDAAVDERIAGDPLGPAEEAALIENFWEIR
jgi:anti-sigma factor RsiW